MINLNLVIRRTAKKIKEVLRNQYYYSLPTIVFHRNITLRLRIEHVFIENTIYFKWKKILNVTLRLIKVIRLKYYEANHSFMYFVYLFLKTRLA